MDREREGKVEPPQEQTEEWVTVQTSPAERRKPPQSRHYGPDANGESGALAEDVDVRQTLQMAQGESDASGGGTRRDSQEELKLEETQAAKEGALHGLEEAGASLVGSTAGFVAGSV